VSNILYRRLNQLREFFVVSHVSIGLLETDVSLKPAWTYSTECSVNGEKIAVHVHEPSQIKCVRCWGYTVASAPDPKNPLCDRCVGVLNGIRGQLAPDLEQALLAVQERS
jgi:hypothetical protein